MMIRKTEGRWVVVVVFVFVFVVVEIGYPTRHLDYIDVGWQGLVLACTINPVC